MMFSKRQLTVSLILILAGLLTSAGEAWAVNVKGQLLNPNGKPYTGGAYVQAYCGNNTSQNCGVQQSDANGNFNFQLNLNLCNLNEQAINIYVYKTNGQAPPTLPYAKSCCKSTAADINLGQVTVNAL